MRFESITHHFASVEKYYSEVAVYFTVAMTGVTWALGGWDTALKVLIALALFDICTGVLRGFFVDKKFSSARLRKGFGTKIGYLIVIALCNMLDMVFFAENPILRTASVWFYVYVEGSSTLENLANLGVPIPQFLVDRMEQINDKVGIRAKMKSGKFVPCEKSEDKKESN
ncbi:phage holin family protein [Bacillus spizizenii]|nr:phage holin family protein [Bacillus spizizenii]MCY9124894.1 phage holin family protein [Bacillus spizizenii]